MNSRRRKDIYWKQDELHSRQLLRLEAWKGHKKNKELILEFQDYLFAKGTKEVRIAKLLWGLRNICDWLQPVLLSELTSKSLQSLVAHIHRSNYKDTTKSDYKRCLKQFYGWYEDEDSRLSKDSGSTEEALKMYKYLKKHVKTTCKEPEHDPASIITEADIEIILRKGCSSDMERAFISLLHETGCRIGEFLGIRLKDLNRKESHWIVHVTGKTGERSVPFRTSIPYILRWLDLHPTNDPEDYLWISIHPGRFKNKPLIHFGALRLLDRCFKRGGISKKHNPHWFRHSRSTLDAAKYNDVIHSKIRGWVIGSSMARRYTHLSAKDVENEYLQVQGIEKPEEVQVKNQPLKCVCGRLNTPEASYCSACGKALSVDVALKEQEYLERAFGLLGVIMSNPELKAKFEKFKEAEEINSFKK